PRSEAYFVFPLAQGTPGKQCGLAATGVYQPSLRSPWLAALDLMTIMTRLDKYRVLIIDDIGYVKKTDSETQVLFEFIAHRYESGSLIITSNQPFSHSAIQPFSHSAIQPFSHSAIGIRSSQTR
uniref:ATP-binding protein n=1 Tax=Thiolapillus sp. TaxID=2017437 RepID=UPI003AF7B2FD